MIERVYDRFTRLIGIFTNAVAVDDEIRTQIINALNNGQQKMFDGHHADVLEVHRHLAILNGCGAKGE